MRKREEFQLALHVCWAAAHQALHGIDGALGLGQETVAGGFSDNNAAIGIKTYDRRTQRAAVRAGDTLRLAPFGCPYKPPGCSLSQDRCRRFCP